MNFTCSAFELHVTDLAEARRFYIEQLGLQPLQETPALKLLAVHAGIVRLSIFGDRQDTRGKSFAQITLGTDNIDTMIAELKKRGVDVGGPPIEAPGFMRFILVHDPDGNTVGIAQYLRDPLMPV